MPAAIPDRYSLEVRLGRDGDLEEWLATDTSLDRPVLIRSLGPESTPERRSEFVQAVSEAAKTTHAHLARVYTVARVDGGAYAVSEWTGGATVADRIAAHQPIDLPDFLPNAAGLAGALAALHDSGAIHGRIDTSAISYSGAHPAKLGALGRPRATDGPGDVRALAGALETALTGSPPGGPPPSERVDGVPRSLDGILRSAQSGAMTAGDLEKALLAAPTPREPRSNTGPTSRRLILAALALILLAVALVVVGFFLSGGSAPVVPTPTTEAASPTTVTTEVTTTLETGSVAATDPTSFDPFGEGGENDDLVGDLIDDDVTTEWRTERYLDPLPLLKPGVGVTIEVVGQPRTLTMVGLTDGTSFDLYWATERRDDLEEWERIGGGNAAPGSTEIDLAGREDGVWLIWLTTLGINDDGTHQTSIAELRFDP